MPENKNVGFWIAWVAVPVGLYVGSIAMILFGTVDTGPRAVGLAVIAATTYVLYRRFG